VHDLKVSGRQAPLTGYPKRKLTSPDSLFWLVLVSVAFLAAELTPALLRMPLGADEITYLARTSAHASTVSLPPVHGQGMGLLAAPVTLFTTSLTAIRVWMSVLSAVGLFLAVLCWRGLRPVWVLALAELVLASLAITQNSGVQIYPDWWGALGLLALTGLFLNAVNGRMRARVVLPLIGFVSLVIVLMRPQNVVFLMGPVILACLVVRGWRNFRVLAAMAVGTALGFAEWVAGAYIWFGGLFERINLAGQEPPPLHLYFALGTQLRYINGSWYCSTGCTQWAVPYETPWWIAFLAVAILGLWAGWHRSAMKASSVLAGASALWVFLLYAFLVPFGAPRYLLPTYALMSILVADGLIWAVTESRWRKVSESRWRKLVAVAACLFLLGGIASQRVILQHQAAGQTIVRQFPAEARELEQIGVHPPCVMDNTSIAYYLGCSAPWTTSGTDLQAVTAFVQMHAPGGLKHWRLLPLPAPQPGDFPPVVFLPASSPVFRSAQSIAHAQAEFVTIGTAFNVSGS
jgi:hypothetical protein